MFRFEKLDVWKKAIEFADRVYHVTRTFPPDERYGLISQMRRASISISSNIAEGTGRSSDHDYARFLQIGYGSMMETVSQMFIARRQSFLSDSDFDDLYSRADELARMLSGLRNSLVDSSPPKRPQ
ncbi:MAG: four helix bundle protein [Planctomycetaceae bacterium]